MQLVVMEDEPVLFDKGEVLEAEIISAAGFGRAVLVVDRNEGTPQWLSPEQAAKERLAVTKATPTELGALRGAGYHLPYEPLAKA